MADDFADKTEDASSKKLTDARQKGQVAKSMDFNSALLLFGGMLVLFVFSWYMYERLANLMTGVFNNLNEPFATVYSIRFWVKHGLTYVILIFAPLFATLFVLALFANVYQVGFTISTYSLMPKWNKLNFFNPSNFKKFFNSTAIVRLLLGLAKLAVIGVVTYLILMWRMPQITRLIRAEAKEVMIFLFWTMFIIGIVVAVFLFVLGIVDLLYQRWKFRQDMKMTKQEVKDERKQAEGDAQVKGKLRRMMASLVQSRMKANVPHADVVVTNPTHFAVALKYDPENMPAPMCVAKGARKMALSIKEIAAEHKIPVVENKPLARGLYRTIDVGQFVPPEYYSAVAEVLAYIYRLNEEMARKAAEHEMKSA